MFRKATVGHLQTFGLLKFLLDERLNPQPESRHLPGVLYSDMDFRKRP